MTGAQDWEDFYNHDNIQHPTFKEAAISHGYLKDGKEWDDILTVAGQCALPSQRRELFGTLLFNCEVTRPALTRLLAQEEAGQGLFVLDNLD